MLGSLLDVFAFRLHSREPPLDGVRRRSYFRVSLPAATR
jgi:hypothetical protein